MNEATSFSTRNGVGYQHLSDGDLRHAWYLFRLLSYRGLARRALGFLGPSLLYMPLVVRRFLFRQFCGGVSRLDCARTIQRLWQAGVGSILDYAVESATDPSGYDANAREVGETIKLAAKENALPFAVVKLSAIGNDALMEKQQRKTTLTQEETADLRALEGRFNRLCRSCVSAGVPLLVDAEAHRFQGYVNAQVYAQIEAHNRGRAFIYQSFQLYRKDGYDSFVEAHAHCRKKGLILGAKLVRGAYMESERKAAKKGGYESPIHDTKMDCDAAYHKALRYAAAHIDTIALVVATHNEESCRYLTTLMREKGIPRDHPHIHFSQLYGMCDSVSFGLAQAGYSVAKYVPYGPWRKLIPYLYRRAMENSALATQSRMEMTQLSEELKRRKQS